MEKYRVEPDAVEACAGRHEDLGDNVKDIRQRLVAANVSGVSFGKLPESNELHQMYTERIEQELEGLQKLAELLHTIGEGLRANRKQYEDSDTAWSKTFGGGN